MKNILFVCTSNKDRSPALMNYFAEYYPQHQYRSAGVNKYFCKEHKTHYMTQNDIDWADLIVFAEGVHLQIAFQDFEISTSQATFVLEAGEFEKENPLHYLFLADQKLKSVL